MAINNLNLNLNLGQGGSTPSKPWPRFNSMVYGPITLGAGLPGYSPAKPVASRGPRNWNAALRSYIYLEDFLRTSPGWKSDMIAVAEAKSADGTSTRGPAHAVTPAILEQEIKHILDQTEEREDRFMEIIDQHDGEGALNYWAGMLNLDGHSQPKTFLMMHAARHIGEHVVMCLKDHFGGLRPSQICPWIVPMIDPPATPAFPAGHALQSYLISAALADALPGLPSSEAAHPLFALAERVSDNRVIAGLHFRMDNEAGRDVALACHQGLKSMPSWQSLIADVRAELPHYS